MADGVCVFTDMDFYNREKLIFDLRNTDVTKDPFGNFDPEICCLSRNSSIPMDAE